MAQLCRGPSLVEKLVDHSIYPDIAPRYESFNEARNTPFRKLSSNTGLAELRGWDLVRTDAAFSLQELSRASPMHSPTEMPKTKNKSVRPVIDIKCEQKAIGVIMGVADSESMYSPQRNPRFISKITPKSGGSSRSYQIRATGSNSSRIAERCPPTIKNDKIQDTSLYERRGIITELSANSLFFPNISLREKYYEPIKKTFSEIKFDRVVENHPISIKMNKRSKVAPSITFGRTKNPKKALSNLKINTSLNDLNTIRSFKNGTAKTPQNNLNSIVPTKSEIPHTLKPSNIHEPSNQFDIHYIKAKPQSRANLHMLDKKSLNPGYRPSLHTGRHAQNTAKRVEMSIRSNTKTTTNNSGVGYLSRSARQRSAVQDKTFNISRFF